MTVVLAALIMAICKYFLSGNCRYGSRCVNEHFDLKHFISAEVQAALKGSQWPLSCFGPFREKPCLPNFIEDQSFEEVRLACYNAKKENYFPAYQQQITQQVIDAQNKMKMLLQNKREIVDIIVKLYDDAEQTQKTGQQQISTRGNPFSITTGTVGQSSSAGLFGNAAQTNPFAAQGSVFAGPAASSGSLFGAQPAAGSNTILGQSVFGNTGFQTNQNSVFGGQQSAAFDLSLGKQQTTAQSQEGNIFGIASPPVQLSGGSIFGVAAGQQQTSFTSSGQAFGTTNLNQTSVFSPNQQSGSFGSFGQAPGFNTQASTNFGQQQPFHQPPPALANQPIAVQQQQTSGLGIFGGTGQQGFCGQTESNATEQFGSSQGNFFSQTQSSATPFANQNTCKPSQNNLQQSSLLQATIVVDESTYSKMEQLSPEEINAFKADRFEMGKIPVNPPPRELI